MHKNIWRKFLKVIPYLFLDFFLVWIFFVFLWWLYEVLELILDFKGKEYFKNAVIYSAKLQD